MSPLTPEELDRQLKQKKIHAVYALVGPEEYLRRQCLIRLKAALLEESAFDFNWEEFTGGRVPAERILGVLRTLPVMSPRRAVLVSRAEDLTQADQEVLASYMARPNPRSTLILTADEADRRSAWYRALKEHAQLVEFPKVKGYALTAWAGDYIRAKGKAVSAATLKKLVDLAGSDLQSLACEIEKLLLYVGDERVIPPRAVEELVHGSRQHSIFELTGALGRRDRAAALRLLGNLLDSGEYPLAVLAMIARHFRQILIAKEMMREGRSAAEIGQVAQIPAFMLDDFLRQARAFDQAIAERIFARIAEIDLKMKSTGADERGLLVRLICSLPEAAR